MTELIAGKYELVERIGFGGMAEVWSAVVHGDAGFRRPVAIKRLLPNLAGDEEFAVMFLEEARVVSALDHPNIVATLDFCTDGSEQFLIVMELVEGIDLGRWILQHAKRDEETPWQMVATIAMHVLRALSIAHERVDDDGRAAPVFHRDVTPSNVLLGRHGTVKLGDFGLARAMDRVTLTTPGVVKGKLSYVAPEIVGGARSSYGTDLYSLGVVLWETLAMRRLFEGVAELELFVKVGEGRVPHLRDERKDVPPRIHTVLERLVAKAPDDRFPSARSALAAFGEAIREEQAWVSMDDLAASVHEAMSSRSAGAGGR